MNTLPMSKFLSELLERSKNIGTRKNCAVTAERFMAVLFDMAAGQEQSDNSEWRALSRYIDACTKDPQKAKEALLSYSDGHNTEPVLDALYMRKKIMEAGARAGEAGLPELTSAMVLECILQEPSKVISQVLEAVAKEESDPLTEAMRKFDEMAEKEEDDKLSEPVGEHALKPEMAQLVSQVRKIRTALRESVFGQDNAINVFATGYFQASLLSMIDKTRKRPRATFLFAGPPGVGKTFLAETVAKELALPFARFDMSEYAGKEADIEFCGSDKVYKNGKEGNVTQFVARNPKCVLLFDEIEKAHTCVIHLFLQLLDAGRLRDNYTDEEVSFGDAIIILTTNAGRQLYENSESGDLSTISRKVVIKALQNDVNLETGVPFFPSAICSRLAAGNVVMFNHISAQNLRTIAEKEIRRHAKNLETETGMQVEIDERVYTALLFSEGGAADARTVRGRAETFFNDELYELLRLIASDKVKTGIEAIEKIRIEVDLLGARKEICELFTADKSPCVLMLADERTVELCRLCAPDFAIYAAQTVKEAVEALKKQSVDFVLLDMLYGAPEHAAAHLNIEDVPSLSREFFRFLREHGNELPVYLLEGQRHPLSEEEKVSVLRQGVRGVLTLGRSKQAIAKRLQDIATALHRQAIMGKLARENKLVSFETAQTISKDGKTARIKLFDFETSVAVDSEDTKNVLAAASRPNVRFADVIGTEDAKQELQYFVQYLKNPKKYIGTGVKAPRGVLLYGPPGTGKTLLAKAMACESGVTFLCTEGNAFLKQYVGQGPEKVHELFRTARKYAPSILFVDEIDAIAKQRRGGAGSGATGEEILTSFLAEMDGFSTDPTKPVFVLAATNFDVEPGGERSLDPALLRRFDRTVYMDLPTKEDRVRFLKMKIAKNEAFCISLEQIDAIALRSTGMSLALLDSAMELALRSAIRQGSTKVTDAILDEAFETFIGGETKKWDASQLERVARHEAGHALMCYLGGQTPAYLTVVARGNHGGYMQHAENEGKQIYTLDEILANIRTSLGGRAAEIVYYGSRDGISTGASGDLAAATRMARRILCSYGMDDVFGLAVFDGYGNGAEWNSRLHEAVNRILSQQMELTLSIISENKDKIDRLVHALLEKNRLNANEIEMAIMGRKE